MQAAPKGAVCGKAKKKVKIKMNKKNKKGFTLVELVIVIAVIAILAGVMITTFSSVVTSARQSADLQEVKQKMDEKLFVFIADNKGQYPNCFVWSDAGDENADSTEKTVFSVDEVEFGYEEFMIAPFTFNENTEENKEGSVEDTTETSGSGTAYYVVSTGEWTSGSAPTSGEYYEVAYTDYKKDGNSGTATWTVTKAKKESTDTTAGGSKTTTYYATTATIEGKKGTNITLSFDAGTGNYTAEIKKEK